MSETGRWLLFAGIAALALTQVWFLLRKQRSPAAQNRAGVGEAPAWNAIDIALGALFVAGVVGAFVLEHVYHLSGHSPQRVLSACVFSYVFSVIAYVAEKRPYDSRVLYQLHDRGNTFFMSVVFFLVGTGALAFFLYGAG